MSDSADLSNDLEQPGDFQHALTALIDTAVNNDIDVEGGWEVPNPHETHDYGVEIYRVARDGHPEPSSTETAR